MNNLSKTHEKVSKAINDIISDADQFGQSDTMRYFLEVQSVLTKLYNAGYSEGFADCLGDININK